MKLSVKEFDAMQMGWRKWYIEKMELKTFKKFGFVNMEIPKDFKGIPDDVLLSLAKEQEVAESVLATIAEEKHNFATTHEAVLKALLAKFSIGGQIQTVRNGLEATSLVCRITGWIPSYESRQVMKELEAEGEKEYAKITEEEKYGTDITEENRSPRDPDLAAGGHL